MFTKILNVTVDYLKGFVNSRPLFFDVLERNEKCMIVNFICTHKHRDVNAMYCIWCTDGINSRQCFAWHNTVVREVKITPHPHLPPRN